jgi:uncharacterized MnhB-related membrane protein
METFINIALFTMLVLTAIFIVRMRRLFAAVMTAGVFSLLSALLFVVLDAVDVAFTEAAVGAGISTVLMLGTLALTSRVEKPSSHSPLLPLFVVAMTGAALLMARLICRISVIRTRPRQCMWRRITLAEARKRLACPTSLPPFWQVIGVMTRWAKRRWCLPPGSP